MSTSSSSPGLRLRIAMEQRARRLEMENLLRSDNPILVTDAPFVPLPASSSATGGAIHPLSRPMVVVATTTPSPVNKKNKTKRPSAAANEEQKQQQGVSEQQQQQQPQQDSTSANNNTPSRKKPTTATTAVFGNVLSYIVDAVNEAREIYHQDPAAFRFYTLVLAPPELASPEGQQKQQQEDDEEGQDQNNTEKEQKEAEVDAQRQPQPRRRAPSHNYFDFNDDADDNNNDDDDGNNVRAQQASSSDDLASVFRSRQNVRARGDLPPPRMNTVNANSRKRNSALLPPPVSSAVMSLNPSAITADILPVVCDYINSRLAPLGLQSIALPTLSFPHTMSTVVAETLLSRWIVTAHGGAMLKLKNLFLSDSVNFTARDYSRVVEALNKNRMHALAVDQQEYQLELLVQRAATHMEWCGGRRQLMVRNDNDRRRRAGNSSNDVDEMHEYQFASSGANSVGDVLPEAAKSASELRRQKKMQARERNWIGAGGQFLQSQKAREASEATIANRHSKRGSMASATSPPSSKNKRSGSQQNQQEQHQQQKQRQEEQQQHHGGFGSNRDPATISEVELQGPFGRVIASESKRRYRLMQIELDALVPILVSMSLHKQMIAPEEAAKRTSPRAAQQQENQEQAEAANEPADAAAADVGDEEQEPQQQQVLEENVAEQDDGEL